MSRHRSALGKILGTTDEATFFREYWATRPLLSQDGDPGRFDGLFGPDDVEEYLFVAHPPAGDVQLVRQGQWPPLSIAQGLFSQQLYDVQSAYNGLAAGYTIVLNAIHLRWPAARRLVVELEDRLLSTAQTNVYITGPNTQGFAMHQDEHDVFVLQTHGEKRWQIYDKPGSGAAPELMHDVTLRRGDMLYMPKGFPHAASTSEHPSIHLTVGIFALTWLELARQTLETLAGNDSRWSRPVPLTELGANAAPAVADMRKMIDEGLARLPDFSDTIAGFRRGLNTSARRKNPAPGKYLTSLMTLAELTPTTMIERRAGVECAVSTDGDAARIHFMGEVVRAPLRTEAALRHIASHQRFAVADIDGELSDESKLTLIRRLIREGLLEIQP